MPNYSKQGKILQPIAFEQFENAVLILPRKYKPYAVLIYYTGIRVSEALRLRKEAFRREGLLLYVDVGVRLKTARHRQNGTISKGKRTQPLPLDLRQPHMMLLFERVKATRKEQRVFKFNRVSAWRHMSRAGLGYNHLARLSAITFFLRSGYSIAHIINWFGISVQTINHYIGVLDLQEMGAKRRQSLYNK